MALHDEDDFENYRLGDADRERRNGHGAGHDDDRDAPDPRDLVPDDLATLRCQNCRKWILECTERCPYCRHWQSHSRLSKPVWFLLTAIAAVVLILIVILYNLRFR